MDRSRTAPLAAPVFLAALLIGIGACGGDGGAADAAPGPDARVPRGTISMSWRIESGGAVVACADVGASLVTIDLLRQGDAVGESDSFTCTAGEASTRQVNVGTYRLDVDLVGASSDSLLAEPITRLGVEVDDGAETSLGELVFEVN